MSLLLQVLLGSSIFVSLIILIVPSIFAETYYDKDYNFSINYPSGWIRSEPSKINTPQGDGTIHWINTVDNSVQMNIRVGDGWGADQYKENCVENGMGGGYSEIPEWNGPACSDFKVEESKTMKINGLATTYNRYSEILTPLKSPNSQSTLILIQVNYEIGKGTFNIVASANNETYSRFANSIDSIIESFSIGSIIKPSPQKQVEKGVNPSFVVCNDHLVLMLKFSDGSPACVKPDTAQILVERGWGMIPSSVTSEQNDSILLPNKIKASNANFTLNYAITGGNLTGIKDYLDTASVGIFVQASSNGNLTIDIPRVMIDSKTTDGKDADFIILINGEEHIHTEIKTTLTDRTLTIPFSQGNQQIEVIGTQYLG